ncbi:hypothetical protein HJG60_007864 [Phyllostomus discolor]|uniref:Uncharacterized protein n=1 Tax=Phyllostomus discolor TaxID=89673 RepID=A0A834BHL7_9CHIR|nr:hypothetical protein HJG60_007864 [Phyllostomus discolor]
MCIINHMCVQFHTMFYFSTHGHSRELTHFSQLKKKITISSSLGSCHMYSYRIKENACERIQLYTVHVTFQILTVCYCLIIEMQYLKYFSGFMYVHNVSLCSGLWDSILFLPVSNYLQMNLELSWRLVGPVQDESHPQPIIPSLNGCHIKKKCFSVVISDKVQDEF